jgi:hypothetical protein
MGVIERAARELAAYHRCKFSHDEWCGITRAVIESLREPSEGMIEAGDREGEMQVYGVSSDEDIEPCAVFSYHGSENIFTAMIDAALSE